MKVETHKFIDLDHKDVSSSLRLKLRINRLYDYEDKILAEDIYGETEGLKERAKAEGVKFTKRESLELDGINRIMNIKKAAYFRIIFI